MLCFFVVDTETFINWVFFVFDNNSKMNTTNDIQLIASPCHLETLETIVRSLLTDVPTVNRWVLVTTMERMEYWKDALKTDVAPVQETRERSEGSTATKTPLVESLPVILLTYETIGALKPLLNTGNTGNILLILDQAENLLTHSYKWFTQSSTCYVRMFTTGIRVEDALSLTILAAKMKPNSPQELQTLRHNYLKAVYEPESYVQSTRETLLYPTYVVLAYAIVNGAKKWVPRWVRSLSSTFTSFQSRHYRGGRWCSCRTQRHRSSRVHSPVTVLSRKQHRSVICRSRRKGGQNRYVTQKPYGGMSSILNLFGGSAGPVMLILWVMSKMHKNWMIKIIPTIIDTILTFLFNLLPGIYKGIKQFANKPETQRFTRQVCRKFKRFMGTMQRAARRTTKSFPGFTRLFHQFKQVFALDSLMAKVMIVMVGIVVLMWLIEKMRGNGRMSVVTKAVNDKILNDGNKAHSTLISYWKNCNDTAESHIDRPKSVNMTYSDDASVIQNSAFLCSRIGTYRTYSSHRERHTDLITLYANVETVDTHVQQLQEMIKKQNRSEHTFLKAYPILIIIPEQYNEPSLFKPSLSLKQLTEKNFTSWFEYKQLSHEREQPATNNTYYYTTIDNLLEFSRQNSDNKYVAQEIHFVRPPSPFELKCVLQCMYIHQEEETQYKKIIGLPIFYHNIQKVKIPVYQYIRKYENKILNVPMPMVSSYFNKSKSPDELLANFYEEAQQEWNLFQTKILLNANSDCGSKGDDSVKSIVDRFNANFEPTVTQIQEALTKANYTPLSDKERLGHYRVEMQAIERKLKNEAKQKELKKELDNLQDENNLKEQLLHYRTLFSKIENKIGVLQGLKHSRSRKRSSQSKT